MNKAFCILALLWSGSFTLASHAQIQTARIYGSVYAREENDTVFRPLENATVQLLLLPDSAYAAGGITSKEGKFLLFYHRRATSVRNVLLKVSHLGMKTCYKKVRLLPNNSELDVGRVELLPQTMTLHEAQIVGELKKMYMQGDTLVYNTDAFKMPKGSVLLELVRRLPGLYFSEKGVLMYMDKRISEIRLNGEGFFTHDLQIALKNVPVKELDQVKVYDTVTEEDRWRGEQREKTRIGHENEERGQSDLFGQFVGWHGQSGQALFIGRGIELLQKEGGADFREWRNDELAGKLYSGTIGT